MCAHKLKTASEVLLWQFGSRFWLVLLITHFVKKKSFFFLFFSSSETTVVLGVYCQKRLSTKAFRYRLLPDSVCTAASQTLLCFCLNTVISYAFEIRHLTHCMMNSLGKLIFRNRKKKTTVIQTRGTSHTLLALNWHLMQGLHKSHWVHLKWLAF